MPFMQSASCLELIRLQGYLDIVRFLCEQGGATSVMNGLRGVDVRSNDGWTPLSIISTLNIPFIKLTE